MEEASIEAQRLWGVYGAVYCFHETFFEVGVYTRLHYMVAFGMGSSWEMAFADAAERCSGGCSALDGDAESLCSSQQTGSRA